MLSLEMLDVAIGMIFIYLLISLICSAINEFIESHLKLRAVDLEQGIRELLNDPSGTGLTKEVYNHSLIYSLFRGIYDPQKMRVNKNDPQKNRYSRGSDLPSYIPARNFALALMDILLPAKASTLATPTTPATSGSPGGSEGAIAAPGDHLPTPNTAGLQVPPVNPAPLQPLRDAVSAITNIRVKTALLTIIDAAGDDVSKAREGIEGWYNSSMDRVSGWYKRRVQSIVFGMGFALAIIMNADSFAIFNNLINDRPLRAALVLAAQNNQSTKVQVVKAQDTTKSQGTTKPQGEKTQGAAKNNGIKNNIVNNSENNIKTNVNDLLMLDLPIGWGWKSELNKKDPKAQTNYNAIPSFSFDKDELGSSVLNWFLKLMGWLVTGFAVSLGAPFWFDTLNRIMIIRSTVKPHEKSPEEASQDRQNSKT